MADSSTEQRNARRTLTGVVISSKGQSTITVEVERTYKHARYGKYLRKKKRHMAHDAESVAQDGDTVEISSTRPISKLKRWRLIRVVTHADLAGAGQSPDRELAEAAAAEEAAATPEATDQGGES
jgi:small subunit ribosomal protein S17